MPKAPQIDLGNKSDVEIVLLVLARSEWKRLYYFLDLLCDHEEGLIESATVGGGINGELCRKDAFGSAGAIRSRRIWRSAQMLMRLIETDPQKEGANV